jgi:FixJ family two-component response regulator
MKYQPTVFLVDPDGPTRDALNRLTDLMELNCQAFDSAQQFLDALDPAEPGCIVMEIKVPGLNGLQIQQRLRETAVTLPVIFITTAPSVSIAVHAMRAGALHFLEKPIRENDLWAVIQEAIQLDQQRRHAKRLREEAEERVGTLTEKEQAVLEMIAEGRAKHSIASELGVSIRTIEHHRTQLMRKLQTNSLAGLMQFALSQKNGHLPSDGLSNHRLTGTRR